MNIVLDLFLSFLKIGFFTIGGGYAMIPLIESTVATKGWMEEKALINFIGIAESTPGPFAINISTFIGWTQAGFLGALVSVLGIVLPSFIIIVIIFYFAKHLKNNKYVEGTMAIIRPVILTLIFSAFASMLSSVIFIANSNSTVSYNYLGIALMFMSFFVMRKYKNIHPVIIIITCGLITLLYYSIFA